ncbi:MAG TPA: PQQ-binding-like beta-propeller repeat protein [Chryseolinea sp.]
MKNPSLNFSKYLYWFVVAPLMLSSGCEEKGTADVTDWPEYNGGPDRNHFSALTQITRENLNRLEKVWEYASGGADSIGNKTQIQCNPIIVDGILFGVTAGSQAFAVDAASGSERWKTDLKDETFSMTSRGLTYYSNGVDKRVFFGYGHLLYALDAATGKPIASFGINGKINLKDGLERPGADDYVVYNTPGVIFKNLLITGQRVAEGPTARMGDIRAFDAMSGKLIWTFHTIPDSAEFGSDTWPQHARRNNGGANSWMGMAIDRENEIVYAPTGSASFDFYGGDRPGSNLFANSLIALDANTGKRVWHYQIVHHDIWDRDLPAPPNLLDIEKDNQTIPAVAQITKQGHVFVFNRLTGEPLFPIEEKPSEMMAMPGEQPFATQPIPVIPEPFTRQTFTLDDLRPDVAQRDKILALVKGARTGRPYLPITRETTIVFPGTDGGAQWGGAAVDRGSIMYVPAKEIPVFTSLIDAPGSSAITSGKKLYRMHCASCHGAELQGDHAGTYPALIEVSKRLASDQVHQLLMKGRGMMPAFTHIPEQERNVIVSFLLGRKDTTLAVSASARLAPYVHTGYNRWYDSLGFPINRPPWGTLTAINLNSGNRLWQVPLGEFPALKKRGVPATGTDNYGGPLVTESGLVFIAATPDKKFRAFDKRNGQLLWETDLPAPGYASPSTYAVDGRQFIVIACGGGKLKSQSGDKYVAFAIK